ncbi:MAG TPA: long-chain fatty acid--CoA ligase [Treponema sp.]|nr:long-chain fatty acid--CoA ligase [Treponema sp.]
MTDKEIHPWTFLDAYRGRFFNTKWPTFPQVLMISADRYPDSPCFTDFEGSDCTKRTLTYAQVLANVRKLAKWMTANGIRKGDKVAVTGKNSPEWSTVYLAALFASGIIVPLDYALHDNETENLIQTAQPKIIFADEEKYDILRQHPGRNVYSLSPKYPETYVYDLETTGDVPENPPAAPDDIAAILFTSGTTGTPKGVMLTHENFISDCYIAQSNFNHGNGDVFYALLPIHHAYTMQAAFINPLSTGAEIVFGKSMAVSRLMKELREGKITVMLGVPLLYNKLLAGITKGIREKGPLVSGLMKFLMALSYIIKKITGKNPGKVLFKAVLQQANIYTLRVAICGGGPLSSGVFKAYNAAGINFIQGYGLTETSPILALNPIEHFKIESVGKDFYPHEEIKILNPDKDGVGEIAVKGPMVMKGYYNMPEETAKMFTEDGFFKTGDIGKLDSEHYLILCGRAKNIIVTSGGKNVYPEEIEDAFQLYDDIQQITVQSYIEDQSTKSEGIEALIYPSDEVFTKLGVKREEMFASDDVKEIIQTDVDTVNRTLQPYARISRIEILEKPLEMTTTLKVKRNYKK